MSHVKNGNDPLPLSVLLITKNEAHNIQECLKSIPRANEIIVVDAESSDDTVPLARQFNARVFVRPWPGFGAQKNFGIDQASSEWILIIDADERVTPELASEIETLLRSWSTNDPVAYRMPRRNVFYGKWVRWGGSYPNYQIRLFRKGTARYNDVPVHENLIVSGNVGTLEGHFDHYTERHITDHFKKFGLYTTLAAQEKGKVVQQVKWYNILFNPLVIFFKTYVLTKGYRDGLRGFILAAFASMYTFVKYSKLWEMRELSEESPKHNR